MTTLTTKTTTTTSLTFVISLSSGSLRAGGQGIELVEKGGGRICHRGFLGDVVNIYSIQPFNRSRLSWKLESTKSLLNRKLRTPPAVLPWENVSSASSQGVVGTIIYLHCCYLVPLWRCCRRPWLATVTNSRNFRKYHLVQLSSSRWKFCSILSSHPQSQNPCIANCFVRN